MTLSIEDEAFVRADFEDRLELLLDLARMSDRTWRDVARLIEEARHGWWDNAALRVPMVKSALK